MADGVGPRVWLTGLMGAGKTTVGRKVAAALDVPYLDNDTELARRTGKALREWEPGDALHDAEEQTLRAMAAEAPPFVAGVPASAADRPALLAAVAASGLVVHLAAPLDALEARVEGTGRPLGPDARTTLEHQLAARDPAYRAAADLVVDTSADDVDDVVARILDLVVTREAP